MNLSVSPSLFMQQWLKRQTIILFTSAIVLLIVFENTNIDLIVSEWLYDRNAGDFIFRHHWLFEKVLHHGMKTFSFVAVFICLYFCWQGHKGRLSWLPQRNAWVAASGMILIPIVTTLLKHFTNRHCPWDVIDFGGFAPYQGLLTAPPEGMKGGQCFPAGHAAGGFLWLIWAIALRPMGKQVVRLAFSVGLGLGFLMGVARMAQGAHFISHTLWTLWLTWCIGTLLVLIFRPVLESAPISTINQNKY